MKRADSVRTSVDIPRRLHRELHEAAARRGCSARQLILESIEHSVTQNAPKRRKRRLSLEKPIVPTRGKPFNLTESDIYELVELP